jgi:hypothetical protein
MINEIKCPACGQTIQVDFTGQPGACAKCGHKFTAPPLAPPPMPYHGQSRKSQGPFILALVAVVAAVAVAGILVLSIVSAIAIPNLVRAVLSANESAAIGAMRTISSGQASFQSAAVLDADNDRIGEFGTLRDLGDASPPYIDSALASGEKHGYRFVCTPNKDLESGFKCTAEPLTPGRTGNRRFFVDESGVITFNPSGPADATNNPV